MIYARLGVLAYILALWFGGEAHAASVNCQVYAAQPGNIFAVGAQPIIPCDRTGTIWSNSAITSIVFPTSQKVNIDQTTPGTTNGVVVNSSALPTLAATSTLQSNGGQKTQIVDAGGVVWGFTGSNANVQCANCTGTGASATDGAVFAPGASTFTPNGGFFQTTPSANPLTNGQQGFVQMTAQRAFFSNLRDAAGAELGIAAAPLQVSLANTAVNGTAVAVSVASLPLPTGAATAALQTTGNTALSTINTTLGLPFQANGSIANTAFIANAGTNLNTSALALSANQTNNTQTTGIVQTDITGNGVEIAPTAGAAAGIAPVVSGSLETGHVLKAGAGNLYGVEVQATTVAGFLEVFNSTTVPAAGAVTPVAACYVAINGTCALNFMPPLVMATGISVAFSSSATPFTKTDSATALLSGQVK
jgi:hypothetical protein